MSAAAPAAKRPPPIIAGNLCIHWVPAQHGNPAGYPLPGGEITADATRAAAVAESIAQLSEPLALRNAWERERRAARIRSQFPPTT